MVTNYATYSNPDKLERESLDKEMGVNNTSYVDKGIDLSNEATRNQFIKEYQRLSTPVTVDTTNPITANTLTNAKNITVPNTTVNTTNINNLTANGYTAVEQADTDLKQSEKDLANTNKPESVKDGFIAKYLGLNKTLEGKADETAKLQEEQQLAEKTKIANDINNKILATSRAYEKQIRETERTSRALSGGVNIETQRIAKQRDEQLADLSIQKAVALGDIDTANKIVETAIAAKYDPIQAQLDNYEKLISFAQNDMTESEKFEAQNKLNSAKEDLDYKRGKQESAVKEAYSNGQYKLAAELNNLNPEDKDFGTKLNSGITKLVEKQKDGQTFNLTPDQRLIANTILSSGKFTKDQSAQILEAVGSGMDLSSTLKNIARRDMMTGTTATNLEGQTAYLKSAERLSTLLDDFYANGGSTNIFSGNMEKVVGKLGAVNDPKLRSIATDIERTLQSYRKAISGTAYSNQEGQAIASIFPGINKTEGLNNAIMESNIRGATSYINDLYEEALGKDVWKIISPKQNISNKTSSGKSFTVDSVTPLKTGYSGSTSSGIKFTIE